MRSVPGRQDSDAVVGGAPRIYELLVSESPLINSQLRWEGFRRLALRSRNIVSNSPSAVLEALKAPTDVVVLESNAAQGELFALCSTVKKACPALPVVVICERALSSDMAPEVAASGCTEVLSGPLARGQLYHVVAKLLDLPRRRNYRVKVQARVSARGTFREIEGEVSDLSGSGAHIRLEDPFLGASPLSVVIEAPERSLELNGDVIWHRPSVRGGELAVQFKSVSEHVAARLEALSTWRLEQRGEQQTVVLQRSLNERTNFTGLPELLRGHVVFDMEHLTLIASAGVGAWVGFLRELSPEVSYELVRCPVNFCVQASYIPDMLGRGEVKSLYAPYYCAGCNRELERQLPVEAITDPQQAPELDCSVCGGKLEFADLPERFYKFLGP